MFNAPRQIIPFAEDFYDYSHAGWVLQQDRVEDFLKNVLPELISQEEILQQKDDEIDDLRAENAKLFDEKEALDKQIAELKERVRELQTQEDLK